MKDKFKLSKKEAGLICGIILISAVLALKTALDSKKQDALVAKIIYNSVVIKEVSLDQDMVFSLTEIPQITFEIKNGAIGFIESDCPDKICIKTGMLSHSGQNAACLPNGAALVITGGEGLDAIAQ